MLSKNQWLWCAKHYSGIRVLTIGVGIAAIFYYGLLFVGMVFSNIVPDTYMPPESQMQKMNCRTYEVGEMFIPSVNKIRALNGDMRNYVPEPLERQDARVLFLEMYNTHVVGTEILTKRPECIGAYIADNEHSPYPSVLLIVDRNSGKNIFRIARLNDPLTR